MTIPIINKRRVLKNTLYLYSRMFITIIVSLYTSRITLQYLGVEDFGIQNVVGGFVSMFGFITVTMSNASIRFFSISLGRGNVKQLTEIFKTTVTIYIVLISVIFIIAETFGLWFVWYRLNIPAERHSAAMIIYQISLLTFYTGLIRIPYNSTIIAREQMSFFAYTSIVEVVSKLVIVFLLVLSPFDKLIFYSTMILVVSAGTTIWYVQYCKKRFSECIFAVNKDKENFKAIFSFAGWNFTSNIGDVLIDQGINILINIFFGPAVNAARAIAYTVKTQIQNFSWNFLIAATPQITKLYALGEKQEMSNLVNQTSKVGFYLMFIMAAPMYVGMEMILKLWLKEVPDWTLLLTRLALINIVVSAICGTLQNAIQSTGNIKTFVLLLTFGKLIILFLTYLAFRFTNATPEFSIYCTIIYALFALLVECIIYPIVTGIKLHSFLSEVVVRAVLVVSISVPLIYYIYTIIYNPCSNFTILFLMFISLFIVGFFSLTLGCNKTEKVALYRFVLKLVKTNFYGRRCR